jgi:hypothetical protein
MALFFPAPIAQLKSGEGMFAAFCLALARSAFAKGRARILLLAWSVSMVFVFCMVYLLQFD